MEAKPETLAYPPKDFLMDAVKALVSEESFARWAPKQHRSSSFEFDAQMTLELAEAGVSFFNSFKLKKSYAGTLENGGREEKIKSSREK